MEKLCLVGGLEGLHRGEPCESRRKADVGHWTEMSPSRQDRKERLEVSRNGTVFYDRKEERIIWQ